MPTRNPYKTPVFRPIPGDPWWEFEVHHALMERLPGRLEYLVRLAEQYARREA